MKFTWCDTVIWLIVLISALNSFTVKSILHFVSSQKHCCTDLASPRQTPLCYTPLPCPRTQSARWLTWGRCRPDTMQHGRVDGTGKTENQPGAQTSATKVPKHTHAGCPGSGKVRSRFAGVYPKVSERRWGMSAWTWKSFRSASCFCRADLPSVLLTVGMKWCSDGEEV